MELIIEEQPENFESILPVSMTTTTTTSSFVRNLKSIKSTQVPTQKKLSYDDILQKMGLYVQNGELHLLEDQKKQKMPPLKSKTVTTPTPMPISTSTNSKTKYLPLLQKQQIELTSNLIRPKNMREYRQLLIQDFIQKERIRRTKSTKLMILLNPTNGRTNTRNMNKLFNWKS